MNKVVYAVTSNGADEYAAMTWLSAAVVRATNPGVKIAVACDAPTANELQFAHHPLLDMVDALLPVDTPDGVAQFRNRFVKTSLRETIPGPFLFLDSDVVVRGSLDSVFETAEDIAAAPNHSSDTVAGQLWPEDASELDRMEWITRPDVYVNCGVLFYNDTEGARRFGAEWHERWLRSSEELGRLRDQPAGNSALAASCASLRILPHRFNAQFRVRPSSVSHAVVWHYYSGAPGSEPTLFESMVGDVMAGRFPGIDDIRTMARRRHPWLAGSIRQAVRAEAAFLKGAISPARILPSSDPQTT